MAVQTKICGLSTPGTLDAALRHGASHVGFVFFAKSPRNLPPEQAAALAAQVPGHVKKVGVVVDPERGFIDRLLASVELDVIQLHGNETPAEVARLRERHDVDIWKAIPVRTRADLKQAARYSECADRILFDAKTAEADPLPGGMGVRFDWQLLEGFAHELPWGLSGGLDSRNVADAVGITGAPLVDVSSGVESAPGVKEVDRIAVFLKAALKL